MGIFYVVPLHLAIAVLLKRFLKFLCSGEDKHTLSVTTYFWPGIWNYCGISAFLCGLVYTDFEGCEKL